jgi:hypothetical protein
MKYLGAVFFLIQFIAQAIEFEKGNGGGADKRAAGIALFKSGWTAITGTPAPFWLADGIIGWLFDIVVSGLNKTGLFETGVANASDVPAGGLQ